MTLALRYAVRSDVGLLREGNEDSAYAGPRMLAVADGMGGHAAGEIASAVAISALAELDEQAAGGDLLGALAKAVASANQTLHDMVEADPAIGGMGTTLTAMLCAGSRIALCHIGDSRAYMLRDGAFYQITHDHTLVQSLVDDGRISPDEAATHPQRSLLLRALDGSADVVPDLELREARVGDRYLLCSDGLSGVVSEDTLHMTLATVPDLDDVVLQLVELAIKGGGPDNITCIVADVVDSASSAQPPSQAPVLAGAASNGAGRPPRLRTDSPAGRAHVLSQTAPQAAIMVDDDPRPRAQPADEDSGLHARRRWPIVTSVLVLLLLVLAGAGYASWQYSQSQYYVGADNGQAVIYRGINQTVAGISLSHVYRHTGIPLNQLPVTDQQGIQATISASSLAAVEQIVSRIRGHYQECHNAYAAQRAYQSQLTDYHNALNAYRKAHHGSTKPVTIKGKLYKPPAAPKQPAPVPAWCPAQPATSSGAGGGS